MLSHGDNNLQTSLFLTLHPPVALELVKGELGDTHTHNMHRVIFFILMQGVVPFTLWVK